MSTTGSTRKLVITTSRVAKTLAVIFCVTCMWQRPSGVVFVLTDSIHSEAEFVDWISNTVNQTATLYGNITLTQPLPTINRTVYLQGGFNMQSQEDSFSTTSISCSSPIFTALTFSPSSIDESGSSSLESADFYMAGLAWSGCGTVLKILRGTTAGGTIDINGCTFRHNTGSDAVSWLLSSKLNSLCREGEINQQSMFLEFEEVQYTWNLFKSR